MRRYVMPVAVLSLMALPAYAELHPGMYETTTTATAPGMPQPQTDTHSDCMSADDAKDPVGGLLSAMSNGGKCDFTNKSQTGDHFISDYSCENQGQKIAGHIDMTFGTESIDGSIAMNFDTPQGKQTVTTTIKAKRTGDCPPG